MVLLIARAVLGRANRIGGDALALIIIIIIIQLCLRRRAANRLSRLAALGERDDG